MSERDGARTYDYVIVGAGSAGCVLAGRLSEDPDARVALLDTIMIAERAADLIAGPDRVPASADVA